MPLINSSFTSTVRAPRGDSLLDYLARRFDYHARAEWESLLALGRLELEGRPARGDEILREGQTLRFAVVDYDEPDVPTDFRVLASGDTEAGRPGGDRAASPLADLAFVHKPADMPVHRTGRIFFQTLANLARERLGGPDDRSWAPLNRLDRETSGIVAFARGSAALRALGPSSPEAAWRKAYVAVARGEIPADALRFDEPLGERAGDAIRCRMHAFPARDGGKPALTLGRVLARRAGLSLVVLSPITGRKHQLRAHLAAASFPIVGDKIYSGDGRAYLKRLEGELGEADWRELGARRHLLHAFHLRIAVPGLGAREAWDWDAGGEFKAIFPPEAARDFVATAAGGDFLAEVEAARRALPPG